MKTITSAFLACTLSAVVADEKPNILFIFTDDHAYNTVGSYGNKQIKTPVMDKMAADGVKFTHAYNSGAWRQGMCLPSRTMMMTGVQLWDAAETWSSKDLRKNFIDKKLFFPQIMTSAGYETYFSGKWHIGNNDGKLVHDSFENVVNIRSNMPNAARASYNRPKEGKPDKWDPADPKFGGFWKGGKHWSEVLAEDGINFINKAAKKDKPFMIYLCFNAPHDPRQAPQKYLDMYEHKTVDLPQPFHAEYPYAKEAKVKSIRDERTAPFPRTEHAMKVNRAEYYALISHTDTQIGRVLDALEKTGKADNTIVIMTSDHGLACGHHGLMGKQNMYEHSLRAPWIIKGPGIPKGKVVTRPIYLQSAMATIIDAGGAKKPDYLAFESVLPIIKDESKHNADKVIYGAYLNTQRMVKTKDTKLIWYPDGNIERLYDLSKDPEEIKDVAKDPAYADKLAEMKKLLKEQMKLMKDPIITGKKLVDGKSKKK